MLFLLAVDRLSIPKPILGSILILGRGTTDNWRPGEIVALYGVAIDRALGSGDQDLIRNVLTAAEDAKTKAMAQPRALATATAASASGDQISLSKLSDGIARLQAALA